LSVRRGNPRTIGSIGIGDLPPGIVGGACENLNDIALVQSSDNRGISIRRAAHAQSIRRHERLRGAQYRRGCRSEKNARGGEKQGKNECKREEQKNSGKCAPRVKSHSIHIPYTRLNATAVQLTVAFEIA
jgi:hypothetical protein